MQSFRLKEFCMQLGISEATGRNWLRLHKITPDLTDQGTPLFSEQYVRLCLKQLNHPDSSLLKTRRNKTYRSGIAPYRSYLSSSSPNYAALRQLFGVWQETAPSGEAIPFLLAECAKKLAKTETLPFLNDLCPTKAAALTGTKAAALSAQIAALPLTYVEKEDTLGFLYLSLRTAQTRKKSGSYYTPADIVKRLTDSLCFVPYAACSILDPGCGSGNFLLQLPDEIPVSCIYGMDIDPISVSLARINLYLRELRKNRITNELVPTLYRQIRTADFLTEPCSGAFTHILGNPPWGSTFSKQERSRLRTDFACAGAGRMESAALFSERALSLLRENGTLALLLPEALLTAGIHKPIRSLFYHTCQLKRIEYLGERFSGVQCPAVLLEAVKAQPFSVCGLTVAVGSRRFTVQKERKVSPERFCFLAEDAEDALVQQLLELPGAYYLKDHAEFGMGIVTGNNKEFLGKYGLDEGEPILTGAELAPFRIEEPGKCLRVPLSDCQQAAPERLYRAPKKLVYRFVSDHPVVACDVQGRLLLNSCNLLIPHLPGLDIRYILAVLNSDVTQFIYRNRFPSLKVLRSYLEQLPIPPASAAQQRQVIATNDQQLIASLFGLEPGFNPLLSRR